jgi:hypothetical protein
MRIAPPRDGISPVAVAGWAVGRFIAEVGEWRKEKPISKLKCSGLPIEGSFRRAYMFLYGQRVPLLYASSTFD